MSKTVDRAQRGFTLIEILVALAIAVVVIGVPLLAMQTIGHGLWHQAGMQRQVSRLDELADQLSVSANSALSVYTPQTTTTGTSCSLTQACSELRFYGRDSSGDSHFWGWTYDSNAKTLSFCKSYAGPDDTACASTGYTLSSVTSFTATPMTASAIAATLGASATGKKVYLLPAVASATNPADPAQRVTAGDSVMVVDVTMQNASREKRLLPGDAPFSANVIARTIQTPQTSAKIAVVNDPSGGANTQSNPAQITDSGDTATVTATESNFGQYEPYLQSQKGDWGHDDFCVTSTPDHSQAATVAQEGQPDNANDSDNYVVTATEAGVSCTFNVYTVDAAYTVAVQIGGCCYIPGGTVAAGPLRIAAATLSQGTPSPGSTQTPTPIGTGINRCNGQIPCCSGGYVNGAGVCCTSKRMSPPCGQSMQFAAYMLPTPRPVMLLLLLQDIVHPIDCPIIQSCKDPRATPTPKTPTPPPPTNPPATAPPTTAPTPSPGVTVDGAWVYGDISEAPSPSDSTAKLKTAGQFTIFGFGKPGYTTVGTTYSGGGCTRNRIGVVSCQPPTWGRGPVVVSTTCDPSNFDYLVTTDPVDGKTAIAIRSTNASNPQPFCEIAFKDNGYNASEPGYNTLAGVMQVNTQSPASPQPSPTPESLTVSPASITFTNGVANPSGTVSVWDNMMPSYSVDLNDGTSPCPYLTQNPAGVYAFGGGSGSFSVAQNTAAGSGSCLLTISTSGVALPQMVKLFFTTSVVMPTTPPRYGGGGGGGGGNCTTIGVYGGGAGTASGMQACKM